MALAPILPSVPLISRAMLARCMIQRSTVSNRNSAAGACIPSRKSAPGVSALATRAERDDYRLASATTSQMPQKISAAGQATPISKPM